MTHAASVYCGKVRRFMAASEAGRSVIAASAAN
jgi:hypothetical protein